MERIQDLYYKDNKYYDYPVEGAKHRSYRTNTTIKIWHEDGTCSVAAMYGEKHYTFDSVELANVRAQDKVRKEYNKERAELMKRIEMLSNSALREMLDKFEKI